MSGVISFAHVILPYNCGVDATRTMDHDRGVQPLIPGIRACIFDAYGTLFDVAAAASQCREELGDRWQSLAEIKQIGPIDFFSQQTIANSVVEGLSTEREKALAIFYFYLTHRYHKGNGDNGAQGDVSQAMNVFGFNTCGNSTLCLSDLLDKVGIRDCIFSHCPGHCVPQIFFDSRYNTLDGDMTGSKGQRRVLRKHRSLPYIRPTVVRATARIWSSSGMPPRTPPATP